MAEKRRRSARIDDSVRRYEMEIADDLGLNPGRIQTEANRPLTETNRQPARGKAARRENKGKK
ncbi:MAG TPA: hypothetical protein GX506_06450 [Firmicutes bacterium]|nr:hypothetical protein [Bacillota bacterium]